MKKEEILSLLVEKLKDTLNERQDEPNQYVVAYFKKSDDNLIGYHASTFCQLTNDILGGKRYSGEDPYPQLAIIAKNLRHTLKDKHEGIFAEVHDKIRDTTFNGMSPDDIYIDAIYLTEGTPKQNFRITVIN